MGMTSHHLALALDDYLRLTNSDHDTRRLREAFRTLPPVAALPPAVRTLARLRWEAEQEVERLIALMDAIDGDPDLDPSSDDDAGHEDYRTDTGGFESNLAATAIEDSTGMYAEEDLGLWYAAQVEEAEAEDEHGGDVLDEPHDDSLGVAGNDCEVSWPESAGAGPREMHTFEAHDDDEDSDPTGGPGDDDNGLADFDGMQEQRGGLHMQGGWSL